MSTTETAVVTGASHGIGAGLVARFLEKGYNVVGNSRSISNLTTLTPSPQLALVDGDVGDPVTAQKITDTAIARFGRIDVLVNNAGLLVSKPFVDQPIAGVPCALQVLAKGGLHAVTRALAIEYAGQGIRINTVALGAIKTPMHKIEAHDFLKSLQPIGRMGNIDEVVDAVMYLNDAKFITGEVLHVDGGAHAGKW